MDPNAFSAPADAQEPRAAAGPAGSVPVAVGVTLLAAGGFAALEVVAPLVPRLPLAAVWVAAGLVVSAGVALLIAARPAAWWPALLAAPLVLSLDLPPRADPLEGPLSLQALALLWGATVGPLVSAAWIGVPLRRLPGFVARAGWASQAQTLGMQLLVPGVVLWLLLPLAELEAARCPDRDWVLPRAVRAWGVAAVPALGILAADVAGLLLQYGVLGGWALLGDEVDPFTAILDPAGPSWAVRFAGGAASALVSGAALAWATRRYPAPAGA